MLNMHDKVLSISEEPFSYSLFPKYKNITTWTDEIIEQYCYDLYLFSESHIHLQFGKKESLKNLLKKHQTNLNVNLAIRLTYLNFFPDKDKSQITTIVDKELKFHQVISEVAEFYPKSKFIILLRDPRDTVLINLKKKKNENKDAILIELAKGWNYIYKTLIDKLKLIDNNRFIKVKYEDLVSNPEYTLKRISNFLGFDFHYNMLNYSENIKKAIDKSSSSIQQHMSTFHDGLTKKVSTSKINVWKTELSKKQSDIIWSICEKTAIEAGYEKDSSNKLSSIKYFSPYHSIHFYFTNILIPKIYFSSPFSIKYIIKKMKYGSSVLKKMEN